MNEVDLRSALRDEADRAEVGEDSWRRLQSRLTMRSAERSPVRSMLRPAIAIVVFAALVGGLLFAVRDDSGGFAARTRVGSAAPRQIVAVTDRSLLVVLDPRTGRVIRTLAKKVATFRGAPELAVSPDGSQVYFTSVAPPTPGCTESGVETVFRVPQRGGTPKAVGVGRTVAVNPVDGRVAFSRRYADCRLADSGALEVQDSNGGSRVYQRPGDPAGSELGLSGLSWSGDGRRLAFQERGASVLDLNTATSLADSVCVCAQSDGTGWFGYRGDSNGFLGVQTPCCGREPHVAVTLTTDGTVDRTLFRWRGQIDHLGSDVSGNELLAVMVSRAGGHSALYRWSRGDQRPTKIRDRIVAAVWIPDPPQRAEPTVAVVRQPGGELEILDSQTGATRQQLGPTVDASQITTTHDGTSLLVGVNTSGPCGTDGAPRIDRVDRANQTWTRFGNGLFPASNGSDLVAYEVACDGISLGITDLKSGDQFRSNPLPGRPRESSDDLLTVHPIAWSPNGRELLYAVEARGSGSGYYVGRLSAHRPFFEARTRLPLDTATTRWVTFVDDGHAATVRWRRGWTEVRVIPIGTRQHSSTAGTVLIGIRGRVTRLAVDASGRRVLLLRDDGVLLTWARGESKPRRVATGIGAATWLPQPSSSRLSSP